MRKRSAYRARPVHLNAVSMAIKKVEKLSRADAEQQRGIVAAALRNFSAGTDCGTNWRSLADTANMAETLSGIGIGSGQQADEVVQAAQAALAAVKQRQAARGTWTLYPAELDALAWLAALHDRQISECSYGEFERAFRLTADRLSQARAGNAARGAILVEGDIPSHLGCADGGQRAPST